MSILDLSKSEYTLVDDTMINQDTQYDKLILPLQTMSVEFQTVIFQEIYFQDFDSLRSINIEESPINIFCILNQEYYEDFLDLSPYKNLLKVVLKNIKNNILLPSQLDKLDIYQEEQDYQLRNQQFSCKDITINNFDISGIIIQECESIDLSNTLIDAELLDLSEVNSLKVVTLWNIKNNILLPTQLDKLYIFQDDHDYYQYKLRNNKISCNDITIQSFDLTGIILEGFQSISLDNTSVEGDILDLSKVKNLKNVTLRNVKNNIKLPSYLDQLTLFQCIDQDGYARYDQQKYLLLSQQLSCTDITINNYDLTDVVIKDCQYIYLSYTSFRGDDLDLSQIVSLKEVTLCNLKNNIRLPKLLDRLYLSQCLDEVENPIQSQQRHKLLLQQISCTDIIINNYNLTNIIIDSCQSIDLSNIYLDCDILDLSKIKNLKFMKLKNIKSNILLPNQLDKLDLSQDEQQHQLHSQQISCADITIHNFDLTGFVIENCKICSLSNCCSNKLILQEFLAPISNTLKEVNLDNFASPEPTVLDFSVFRNLQKVVLHDLKLTGVIFGAFIQDITLSSSNNESLEFLDFHFCKSIKAAYVSNFDVRKVFLTDNNVEFNDCQIKLIDLRKVFPEKINIEAFFSSYKGYCQYIIMYREDLKQQMVYKQMGQEFCYVKCIPYILDQQIQLVNGRIQQLLDQ